MVDQPGPQQTILELVQPSLAPTDPNREKLRVLNQVLGGGSTSRLYRNLRERHGYTYDTSSSINDSRGIGTMTLDTHVQTEFTGPSIQQMLGEVTKLQTAPVPAEELDQAKKSLIRTLPARFITDRDSADTVNNLYLLELPPDYYEQLPARLSTIEAGDLQAVASTLLRPREMKIIIVGDKSKIAPQLEALNLGPITYRNTAGAPTQ